MHVRSERDGEADAIAALVRSAFRTAPHSSGTEAAIVDELRRAGALALSLVAADGPEILGYVAFSPVTIDGADRGWFGLGPVAVRPDRQRRGIGDRLVRAGIERLIARGASGCVVLGNPAYYSRFGFTVDPDLRYEEALAPYFQKLSFDSHPVKGVVAYHEAFAAP